MRKLHISRLLKRMAIRYPKFIERLYFEIFNDNNLDKNGNIVSSVYRIKLMNLIKVFEQKYNIKVWGHVEIWRGDVLDLNDIRYNLAYVLSELYFEVLYEKNNYKHRVLYGNWDYENDKILEGIYKDG